MHLRAQNSAGKPVGIKALAKHLELSPATISLVLNNAPRAGAISAKTRARVLAAAEHFNYKPNIIARSLRTQQTSTIGIVVPEFSEGYFTMVMNGLEESLLQAGYLSYVVSHQGKQELIDEYPRRLTSRSVDGVILVNTLVGEALDVPVVCISGHQKIAGATNLTLDHDRAALLALQHLFDLGHRDVVFMKGPPHIPDSESRWQSIVDLAGEVGLQMRPELCIYLEENAWSPKLGYPIVRDLLQRTQSFTAIFCFNDTAAIGAMRAIKDAGLSCPEDISVVGFDDIATAEYTSPSLTTVRQPLHLMGETAAQLLLRRIQSPREEFPDNVMLQPWLMVRESTTAVRARLRCWSAGDLSRS
jgi:LacI family transcriptional regulator